MTAAPNIPIGARVRVTQIVHRRDGNWETEVVGRVLSAEPEPTGSWYRGQPKNRYWLNRLRIEKDDGEITTLTLEDGTSIAILDSSNTVSAPPADK